MFTSRKGSSERMQDGFARQVRMGVDSPQNTHQKGKVQGNSWADRSLSTSALARLRTEARAPMRLCRAGTSFRWDSLVEVIAFSHLVFSDARRPSCCEEYVRT